MENKDEIAALAKNYMALRDTLVFFCAALKRAYPEQGELAKDSFQALIEQEQLVVTDEFLEIAKLLVAALDCDDELELISAKYPSRLTPQQLKSVLRIVQSTPDT